MATVCFLCSSRIDCPDCSKEMPPRDSRRAIGLDQASMSDALLTRFLGLLSQLPF
jgi:hypothetical protein